MTDAYVGVQDFHIHMQGQNIRDPQGLVHMWAPCVDLSLVPTILTLVGGASSTGAYVGIQYSHVNM